MACVEPPTASKMKSFVSDKDLKVTSDVMYGIDLPYRDVADEVLAKVQSVEPDDDVINDNYGLDELEDDPLGESFDRTVATIIIGMDMKQYLPLFKQADINVDTLISLTHDDLLAIGVTNLPHREIMASTIANIRSSMRRERQNAGKITDLQADIGDIDLKTDDILPQMCYSFKHLNSVVLLLRHFKSQLRNKSLQNQLLDADHSAADAALLLSSEAITQAELLQSQLAEFVAKIEPARQAAPGTPKPPVRQRKQPQKPTTNKLAVGGLVVSVVLLLATIRHAMKS